MYVINSQRIKTIPPGANLILNQKNVNTDVDGGVTSWGAFVPTYATLPTLLLNELNGYDVVNFANTQDAMHANLPIFSLNNTICVVCKLFGGVEQSAAPIFSKGQVEGVHSDGYGIVGSSSFHAYLVRNGNTSSRAVVPFSSPEWMVVIGKRDNSINTSYLNVNGIRDENTTLVNFGEHYDYWRIARATPGNTNSHVQIAEILHYPRTLDENEENSLMLYMRRKYNI